MSDDPTSTELFQALRGQRVEVTGAPGGAITGRLMSIESRTEKIRHDGDTTVDKFYLTARRHLRRGPRHRAHPRAQRPPPRRQPPGPARPLPRAALSTTHSTGLRHLTLDAIGQGQRQLRVSYISEVPVWKSTYRIVFPRDAQRQRPPCRAGPSSITPSAQIGTTSSSRS